MRLFRLTFAVAGVLAALLSVPAVQAEVSEVRFARQLGLGYLQLYVMQEQQLVEKQAERLGIKLAARYIPLGSPAAINDALLTGSADYGAAGVPPFIVLWDKSRSNLQVKGVAALNAQPAFLNTNNPAVKSLRDFTDKDRIALPSVKVALQAILLQMAAEKLYGPGQHERFDPLTVSLAHPDGTAALLAGRTEITAHFTSPPFQYQQLQDPKIRRVVSSYEITDGPSSFSVLSTTSRFRGANPKAYQAVLEAVEQATGFINANPKEAARIFARLDNWKQPVELLDAILADKDIIYSTTPLAFTKFTGFMARTGSIAVNPAAWQELFFPEIHSKPGS